MRVPLEPYPNAPTVARLGLTLEPLAPDGLAAQLALEPAIMMRRSGDSFAVPARQPDGYVVGLAGNRDLFNMAQADDIPEPDSALYRFNCGTIPRAGAARLFCDFLSIHPFANGNRRMGMTLAALYLGRWGWHMRWDAVGIAPLYYAVRCASNGHIGPLTRLFAQHVQSDALRFGSSDQASGQISLSSAARL
ncbi:Fic family protein [Pseudoduganella flava]|uniref:Fic family protein n=1 Tax=Pseudoduganella flava TaxID=871742 RepID=UPI001303A492|nr:Fic family protein [Pseudoduganella flava]